MRVGGGAHGLRSFRGHGDRKPTRPRRRERADLRRVRLQHEAAGDRVVRRLREARQVVGAPARVEARTRIRRAAASCRTGRRTRAPLWPSPESTASRRVHPRRANAAPHVAVRVEDERGSPPPARELEARRRRRAARRPPPSGRRARAPPGARSAAAGPELIGLAHLHAEQRRRSARSSFASFEPARGFRRRLPLATSRYVVGMRRAGDLPETEALRVVLARAGAAEADHVGLRTAASARARARRRECAPSRPASEAAARPAAHRRGAPRSSGGAAQPDAAFERRAASASAVDMKPSKTRARRRPAFT